MIESISRIIVFGFAILVTTGCDTTPQPNDDLEDTATSTENLDYLLAETFTPSSEDLAQRERVIGKWVWGDPQVWIEYRADGTFDGVLDSYIAPSIHEGLEYSGRWEIRDGRLWREYVGNASNRRLVSLWNIEFRDNALGHQMVLNNTGVEMFRIYTRDDAAQSKGTEP